VSLNQDIYLKEDLFFSRKMTCVARWTTALSHQNKFTFLREMSIEKKGEKESVCEYSVDIVASNERTPVTTRSLRTRITVVQTFTTIL
jgi:hypothetical protein